MRLVSVANLKPGLIIGRPIMDESGQILLNDGVELNAKYIAALTAKGFQSIYIRDPEVAVEMPPDQDLDQATRIKALAALRNTFTAIEHEVGPLREVSIERAALACRSDAIRALLAEGGGFSDIQSVAKNILQSVLTRTTLAGLTSIKAADAQLHNHCIDTAIVGIMIARAIGLDSRQIPVLTTGCLLHDIGKIFSKQRADAMSEVRRHTLLGFELLRANDASNIIGAHIALEHHERQDGSGEPRGLSGTNTIDRGRLTNEPVPTLLGEIAAVANLYDNLLNGSPSQPPLPPDGAIYAIRAAAGPHLNRAIVSAFLRMVPVYPLGTEVLVRSERFRNYTGLVTQIDPARLDKPVVTLIRDNNANVIIPIVIDMRQEPDIAVRCKVN